MKATNYIRDLLFFAIGAGISGYLFSHNTAAGGIMLGLTVFCILAINTVAKER